MDLKLNLDPDVVYAMLAAIVAIVVMINVTRIVKIKNNIRNDKVGYRPYDQEEPTWPQQQP